MQRERCWIETASTAAKTRDPVCSSALGFQEGVPSPGGSKNPKSDSELHLNGEVSGAELVARGGATAQERHPVPRLLDSVNGELSPRRGRLVCATATEVCAHLRSDANWTGTAGCHRPASPSRERCHLMVTNPHRPVPESRDQPIDGATLAASIAFASSCCRCT
jgi:hypothetical protein